MRVLVKIFTQKNIDWSGGRDLFSLKLSDYGLEFWTSKMEFRNFF